MQDGGTGFALCWASARAARQYGNDSGNDPCATDNRPKQSLAAPGGGRTRGPPAMTVRDGSVNELAGGGGLEPGLELRG